MVMASGRWLGVRLDLLTGLFTGAVALAAVLVSQDAGRCIHNLNSSTDYVVLLSTRIYYGVICMISCAP